MQVPTRCPWEQVERTGFVPQCTRASPLIPLRRARWLWANLFTFGLLILLATGCARSTVPLDLTTQAPDQDQWKIATTYSREAEVLRQKAQELSDRVGVYERLFGPDSEWVIGTRLLAEYYKEAARERERQADAHLGLVGRQNRSSVEETPRTR